MNSVYQNSDIYRIRQLWCVQDNRTFVDTGYQNSGVYRIPELWYIQDTRTLVYTGYQNSSVYWIIELWCIQDTRTLVNTGYQNCGLYRILELWCIQDTSVYRVPELWYINDTRTLVYTGYQKSTGQISFPVLWILVAWNLYLKTDRRKDTGYSTGGILHHVKPGDFKFPQCTAVKTSLTVNNKSFKKRF